MKVASGGSNFKSYCFDGFKSLEPFLLGGGRSGVNKLLAFRLGVTLPVSWSGEKARRNSMEQGMQAKNAPSYRLAVPAVLLVFKFHESFLCIFWILGAHGAKGEELSD